MSGYQRSARSQLRPRRLLTVIELELAIVRVVIVHLVQLIGLDHVASSGQIMGATGSVLTNYAARDLAGLHALGRTVPY